MVLFHIHMWARICKQSKQLHSRPTIAAFSQAETGVHSGLSWLSRSLIALPLGLLFCNVIPVADAKLVCECYGCQGCQHFRSGSRAEAVVYPHVS